MQCLKIILTIVAMVPAAVILSVFLIVLVGLAILVTAFDKPSPSHGLVSDHDRQAYADSIINQILTQCDSSNTNS